MSLGRTVAELRRSISHAEFVDWMAAYQLEPWGAEAGYIQAGVVASTMANVHRAKDAPFRAISDFMPFAGHAGRAESDALFDPDPDKHSALLEAFFRGISSTV